MKLSLAAMGVACLISLPLGMWLGHKGRGGFLAINVSNVGRAVPSFAPSPSSATISKSRTWASRPATSR